MRPRGENVEYDKLADRFYASNRALADAEKRIAALAAALAESRQLLGVYRTQRDSAEERLRALEANLVEEIEAHEAWKKLAGDKEALNIALEAQLVESTRHRDQNRETAVALQMRVSALEAALRKYGIELVEWTSGVWTYNCRACDHGNGTTFLPTDIEHDPACELMALLKDTASETRDVAGDPIAGMYVRAEMRCRILERAMNLYMDETTVGSPYGEKGLKGVLADREMWTEHFRHAMGLPIQAKTTTDHCHWDDDPDEGFKYFWRTACGNHGSRMGYQFIPPMCPHCERPIDNWSAPTSANREVKP